MVRNFRGLGIGSVICEGSGIIVFRFIDFSFMGRGVVRGKLGFNFFK